MNLVDLVFGTDGSWLYFCVRLGLGIVFFAHGGQKVVGWFGGHGLKGTVGVMKQALGIPPALATLVAFTEFLGGCGMLVGFLVRPAAVGIIVLMVVAIAKVHAKNGFFLATAPGRANGYEYNLVLIAMALAILLGGAGAFSVDRLIAPWERP